MPILIIVFLYSSYSVYCFSYIYSTMDFFVLLSLACALADIALKPSSPRNSQFSNLLNSSIVVDTSAQSISLTQTAQNASDSWSLKSGNICNAPEQSKQRAALKWIKTFVEIDPHHMLPYASGIIGAVLPCFMLCGPSDALQERKGLFLTFYFI